MRFQSRDKQNIKAVILAGSRDFGRCRLASTLPPAVWPVIDKPALEHLLTNLSKQGIKQAVICSNEQTFLLEKSINPISSINVKFINEKLPVGTAGCIREAVDGDKETLLVVCPASIISLPDLAPLIKAHHLGRSRLTVVFNPYSLDNFPRHTSDIYICELSILNYIPKTGYCDIKEGLIPAMIRAGQVIHAVTTSKPVVNFHNFKGYLTAVADYFLSDGDAKIVIPKTGWNNSKNSL